MSAPVRLLLAVAVAAALAELVLAPFMEEPLAAVAFAALFLAGAAWLRHRPGRAAAAALAGLFAVELLALPTYARESAFDWTSQVAFGVLSVAGLVAAARILPRRAAARVG